MLEWLKTYLTAEERQLLMAVGGPGAVLFIVFDRLWKWWQAKRKRDSDTEHELETAINRECHKIMLAIIDVRERMARYELQLSQLPDSTADLGQAIRSELRDLGKNMKALTKELRAMQRRAARKERTQ